LAGVLWVFEMKKIGGLGKKLETVDEGVIMFDVAASLAAALVLAVVPLSDVPVSEVPVGPAETHCVVFVIDQLADGELVMSEPDCFADEAVAEAWTSVGYNLKLSAEWLSGSSGGVAALSTFTLGRHYDGFNGTGSSIRVVGSSCTGGYWNTSSSWDNRISSLYNGCEHLRHWDDPYMLGAAENTYGAGTTDNLSYLDNRTESVSYYSS
jgi:hypothetical protein